MTNAIRSGRAATWAVALLLLSVCAGCKEDVEPAPTTGSAELLVTLPAGPERDAVRKVSVALSGPGLATPLAADLTQGASGWQGKLEGLAVGSERVVTASALDAAGVKRFQGTSAPFSISAGATASVSMTLQLVEPPPDNSNQAPRIDSIVASSRTVLPSGTITLTASAQDPNGDALGYAWSGGAGSFGASAQATTTWTAPAAEGVQVLRLTVTDARGLSATSTVDITVQRDPADNTRVSGKRQRHYVQTDGTITSVNVDLSGVTFGAWVPTADGSGYVYRAGTGQADGSFVINGVDRTPYLLQYNTAYYWMNGRSVDLSSVELGRANVASVPTDPPFTLALDLSGLTPWRLSELDELQFHSSGAGLGYLSSKACGDFADPVEGSTTYTVSLDYVAFTRGCGTLVASVIDPAQGDTVFATQNVQRQDTSGPAAGLRIYEARRGAQLTVTSGASMISLKGPLSPLTTTKQRFDFQASQFEALLLGAHPSAKFVEQLVNVGTLYRHAEFGAYAGYPDLATAYSAALGQGDFTVNLEYGNPYPTEWPRIVSTNTVVSVPFSVPLPEGGTSRPASYTLTASTRLQVREGELQPLAPRVGPPRLLRLNGKDADGSLAGVGETPVVSWSAPTLGTVSLYQMRLYELSSTATGGTTRVLKAVFYTQQTQFQLPPTFLVSGKNYFLQFIAVAESGYVLEKPFLHNGDAYGYAGRFSGVFQR